jgi:uncharacterized DUF497 family protein
VQFRWIDWNRDHINEHGVRPEEAEMVVRNAKPPYPEDAGDDKFYVVGRGVGGRYLQVAYIMDPDGTAFVIHARPLNEREKRRFRRRTRK